MGIAEHLRIHRAAAARSLNEMKEKGLLISQTKHVIRGNRNRKSYFLTSDGLQAAVEVEKNLLESTIYFVEADTEEKKKVKIKELLKSEKGEISLLFICNYLKKGILFGDADKRAERDSKTRMGIKEGIRKGYYFSSAVPSVPHFMGRKEEIRQLKALISSGKTSAIVLQGIAGIGKTSLAAIVAKELRDTIDIFWIQIHPWTGFQSFAFRLLSSLSDRNETTGGFDRGVKKSVEDHVNSSLKGDTKGRTMETRKGFSEVKSGGFIERGKKFAASDPSDGPMDRTEGLAENFEMFLERTVTAMERSPALIILDDCQNANEAIQNFLGALMKQMKQVKGTTFLITTRTKPDFYDRRLIAVEERIHEFTISGLAFDDAFELMNALLRDQTSTAREIELEDASQIDEIIHEHPEAREIAQETFGDLPVTRRQTITQDKFKELYKETLGHPFAIELISSYGFSGARYDFNRFLSEEIFRGLKAEEHAVLSLLSIFRLPVDANIFLEVVPHEEISKMHIENLIKKNLVRIHHGWISLHGIIVDSALSRLSMKERREYHIAAADYYDEKRKLIEDKMTLEDEDFSLRHEWENEHRCIIERMFHLIKGHEANKAAVLIREWGDECISIGNADFYEVLQQLDVNRVDPEQRKELLEIIGDAHAEFGHLEDAILSYRERIEHPGEHAKSETIEEARIYRKIGDLERERGDIDSSIKYKQRSLRIFQRKKDSRKTAQLYNDIALDLWNKKEIKGAREYFLKSLDLLKKAGETDAIPRVFLNLAQLEGEDGDLESAIAYLRESLKGATKMEDKMDILHWSGDFFLRKQDLAQALESYDKGFDLARDERDFRSTLLFTERIAEIHQMRGDGGKALDILQKGITMIEAGSQERMRRRTIQFPTVIHGSVQHGNIVDPVGLGTKEGGIIGQGIEKGTREQDLQWLSRAQRELLEDNYLFAALCEKAASLHELNRNWREANVYLYKARQIYRNFQDLPRAATILLRCGKNTIREGTVKAAIGNYKEAYRYYAMAEDKKGCAISLLNFAGALERLEGGAVTWEVENRDSKGSKSDSDTDIEDEQGNDLKMRERLSKMRELYSKARNLSEDAGFERGVELASRKLAELEKRNSGGSG